MLSAPATIPATSEVTFSPAFAPLSVGTLRCSSASSRGPRTGPDASTGTSPADDTRFGSSNTADVAARRVAKLHLRDALRAGGIGTLKKSDFPSTQGHSHFTTRSHHPAHRWIEAKAHSNPEVLVSHGSARLTLHGRRLIVERHHSGWKQAHIAAAMGVSRKCVKTWIDRHAAEGEAGLVTRSSRPHTMPRKTCDEVEQKVLTARAQQRQGPDVLGPKLGVPARTVSRILRRHGVPYLRECYLMTGDVIRSSKQTAVRYERERPGELVRMDVKKIAASPTVAAGARTAAPAIRSSATGRPRSATTTSTRWSTTTPGWPTQRSCPTRRAPTARPSSSEQSPTSQHTASPASSD